jgi:iron complex outermembrane recepter protein
VGEDEMWAWNGGAAGGRVHSVSRRADNLMNVHDREAASRIKDFGPKPGRNVSLLYRVQF